MPEYKIKNWEKYQHYKKRNPPWIKLHRDILKDRAFMMLADASRLLLMLLWVLAAENKGVIDGDGDELAFILRLESVDLNPLITSGFLISASNTLASASTVQATPSESFTEVTEVKQSSVSSLRSDTGAVAPGLFPEEQETETPNTLSPSVDPIWHTGLDLLLGKGTPEQSARSLLGRLIKEHGEEEVALAIDRALEEQPVDPKTFIPGVLKARKRGGDAQNNGGNLIEGVHIAPGCKHRGSVKSRTAAAS